ncbi:ribonuclease T2-like [Cadophora gregata f. sp. sojae]|nr:ribonuclease T2-like [Cadophora gregata f. sp. sojae]
MMSPLASLLLPLIVSASSVAAAACNADNCLRGLRAPARLAEAQSFCATFTASTSVAIPSFAAAACTGNVSSRVSSACSCIATSTSSSASITSTSAVFTSSSASITSSTTASISSSTSVPVTSSSSSVKVTSTSSVATSSAPTSAPTGTPKVCLNPQLSCQNTTAVEDLCCFNSPGGQLLLTEFWDTAPSTGPNNSWTIHGIWPDKCDGTYEANCDPAREYTNITAILQSYGKTDLLSYMTTFWKDYQGNDESFWEHEWGKHGTCISTLYTKCYDGHKGQEEVVDYFEVAVELFDGLKTFEVLAAAGIIPSTTTTYTLAAIQSALTAAHGFPVTLGCSGTRFEEIWYHYNVLGSVPTGSFIPTSPDGAKSDCPETGIRYVPKYLPASPTTSVPPGSTPTGTPYVGKGFLQAYTSGANKGCLISAGTWYTTGTCATYTASNVADGSGFTLTSSKGPCDIIAGAFSCAAGNTAGVFTSINGSLAYATSTSFYAAAVPVGAVQQKIFTAVNAVEVEFVWQII